MIGKTVAHYNIIEKLGEGGMGAVYLAEDTRLDRKVALKFLPSQFSDDPTALARFEREAKSAAALHHPNIVTVFEIGQHEDRRFIAMAYVGGERLSDLVARKDMTVDRALDIALQVCSGLDEAHRAGIVHRDIKPDNILFDLNGRAMLADFGLATSTGMTKLTQEGSTVGTLHYMSPEQTRGETVDVRSDLFSVGAILYEMLTGQYAFPGEHAAAVVYSISNVDPQPLARFNNDATPELERIVTKALSKNPNTRYQSAADMAADLKALRSGEHAASQTSASDVQTIGGAQAQTRRSPWRVPVIAVGVLAVLFAGYLGRSIFVPSKAQSAIAVLPFVNTSEDPEAEYLSAGVTESLIGRLSALSGLKVMSNLSVSRFKGSDLDPQAIGRQLGVSTILVGHVDTRASKLVVGVELLNVEDGSQLWGDRFDRENVDILAIERDIVARISDKLRVKLTGDEAESLARTNSIDPEAYSLYLKGRYFLTGTTEDGPVRAQEFFRQALEIEPQFAPAYAGLGDCYVNEAWLSSAARDEMVPKAKAALAKALEFDDALSEAHSLSGDIRMYFDYDWAGAEAEFLRAIELKPGSDLAHRQYSSFLGIVGRQDESIEEARRAQTLDPLSVSATHQVGYNLLCAKRYEEAVAEFRKAVELNPTWIWGNIKQGMSYALMGDHANAERAKARADELLDGSPGSPLAQQWLASIELKAGKPERMKDSLDRLLEQSKTSYVDPFVIALFYHDLGENDRALDYLEEAAEVRSPLNVYLKISETSTLEKISSDPRFVALLKRMDFPAPTS